jgi:SAM-dependent methyltransferase
MSEPGARYDRIGAGYAGRRHEDPALARRIEAALGPARTVVNVGAGAGSYEPRDRIVIAVEPSAVMAAQRPPERPAIRGSADALPLHDASVDAALAVLSLHHWHPHGARGVRELCRVARDTVVIVTVDPQVSGRMWLMADYLPEVRTLDLEIFPPLDVLASWLDGEVTIETVPVGRDTPDHTLLSFWAHPERVLDPAARAATSGFARQPEHVVRRVVDAVEQDLASGAWDARHGALRGLEAFDAGLRLVRARR